MKTLLSTIAISLLALPHAPSELRVPAFTAYFSPNPDAVRVPRDRGVVAFRTAGTRMSWYGQFHTAGTVAASVALSVPKGDSITLRLSSGGEHRDAMVVGAEGETRAVFGDFRVRAPGYVQFDLEPVNRTTVSSAEIIALMLSGTPADSAHFNLDPRRNAASVHLRFPTDSAAQITGFYNEVTAVDDPVTTYYMACGFARGYFGMQVNSPTERRIIFSVWDAGTGRTANDRSTVNVADQTQLLAKGDGVVADVFGNEGTGGHSHLVYNWKTGSTQRFFVTAKTEGTHTDYSGYWFHPEKHEWQLIASFRAQNDGKLLRGLYAFSENFGGTTGHLRRKALYGPQWIQLAGGEWKELTTATFSHDATGKENRLDRFMGVESGRFFLSHGGFVDGFTTSGERFVRPASGAPPQITLPK